MDNDTSTYSTTTGYPFEDDPFDEDGTLPAPEPEIVVIGPHSWGKGESLDVAKVRFKMHGGRLKDGYLVLTMHPETVFDGVDGMGRYHYSWREIEGKDTRPPAPEEKLVKGAMTR